MMGIFKRRDVRNTPDGSKSDKSFFRPAVTVERISNYSHKSPKLISDKFSYPSWGNSMPDIAIPDPPDPTTHPAAYLRSIHAVRQRTRLVLDEAKSNALHHFDVDLSKFKDTADYVVSIIRVSDGEKSCLHRKAGTLTMNSGISMVITLRYHLMAAGSISRSEEDPG
jgi:hypothetical protein